VAVKTALKFPPVWLSGIQARAVGRGFAQACQEADYRIYACVIMPDHVHIVLRCPSHRTLGVTIGHFKAQAIRHLNEEGISPCPAARSDQDQASVWGEGKWCGYLNRFELPRAIAYVQANPVNAGLPPQTWNFVNVHL
jgi:REP element-mobilizing transposase RayT